MLFQKIILIWKTLIFFVDDQADSFELNANTSVVNRRIVEMYMTLFIRGKKKQD